MLFTCVELISDNCYYAGETFSSLQYLYRIPSQTIIEEIVMKTSSAIVVVVLKEYLKVNNNINYIHY